MPRFRRSATLATAALLALTLAAPAAAAPARPSGVSPALVDLGVIGTLGLPCVEVETWTGGKVTVTQKRGGTTIATATVTSTTTASLACVRPIAAGDRLVLARGTTKRTVIVPTATLGVNLSTDAIAAALPAGTGAAQLLIQDFTAGLSTGASLNNGVSPAGNGTFGVDTTGTLDLGRGDRVIVNWSDGSDAWRLVRETGTAIVIVGDAQVSGTGKLGSTMTTTLKTAGGTVRGKLAVPVMTQPTANAGFFTGKLRKSGKVVTVKAGNVVTATQLSGSFKVPAPTLAVTIGASSLDTSCPAGSDWLVTRDGTKAASGKGTAGPIHVSPIGTGGPITGGTHILLACQLPSGFGFLQEVAAE